MGEYHTIVEGGCDIHPDAPLVTRAFMHLPGPGMHCIRCILDEIHTKRWSRALGAARAVAQG